MSLVTTAPTSFQGFLLLSEGADTIKSSALQIPLNIIHVINFISGFIQKELPLSYQTIWSIMKLKKKNCIELHDLFSLQSTITELFAQYRRVLISKQNCTSHVTHYLLCTIV